MTHWELEDKVRESTKDKCLTIGLEPEGGWFGYWRDCLTEDGWEHWFFRKTTLEELFIEILRIEKMVGNPLA